MHQSYEGGTTCPYKSLVTKRACRKLMTGSTRVPGSPRPVPGTQAREGAQVCHRHPRMQHTPVCGLPKHAAHTNSHASTSWPGVSTDVTGRA